MNTVHTIVLTYQRNYCVKITNCDNSKSTCADDQEYLLDKDRSSLLFEESSLIYGDKLDKLLLEGQSLPCLNFEGLCKPTLKHPYTIVCFTEKMCLLFHISDFLG